MTAAAPALTAAIGDFRDELLPGAAGGVFVAIDFETADEQRDSACSIALVRVEGDKIVASRASLIRPPRPSSLLSHIHGISEAAQRAAPKLRDIWPDMAPLLEGAELLVAHNATFDRAVMAASWGIRGMDLPGLPWACTVKMARRCWPKGAGLPDHKLPSLVRFLGLPTLNHHNALSDAEACARLVLAARRGAAGQPRPALPVPAPAPAAPAPAPPPLEPALAEVLALVELGRSAYRQTGGLSDIDTLQRSFSDLWARTVVGLAWLAEHLKTLFDRSESASQVLDQLKRLNKTDAAAAARAVCLSSVHRAKGLERERVWMLADTFRPGRSVEEDNLWYVAVTRAKRELLRVEGVR